MTRHLATLSIAPRNRFLRRSFVLWELFCTAHFSSCGTARTLSRLREPAHTFPCSTTATARTRALTARHGINPIQHIFLQVRGKNIFFSSPTVFPKTKVLQPDFQSQNIYCFEAFPVPGYVAAGYPQLMTVSHLCHNSWCYNWNHHILESLAVNKSRNGCPAGNSCRHKVKCIIPGEYSDK